MPEFIRWRFRLVEIGQDSFCNGWRRMRYFSFHITGSPAVQFASLFAELTGCELLGGRKDSEVYRIIWIELEPARCANSTANGALVGESDLSDEASHAKSCNASM